MANPKRPTALSICAGIGMLDRGWQAVTSGRTVGFCEREAFPAAVLLDRMENEALEPSPVWAGNIQDMDLAPFLGVDWILAGIPCQPWSIAGKQEGHGDERHLGLELVRLVREIRPRFVFVENVGGFVQLGLPGLLGDLAGIGYDAEWLCCKASDVGAPHRRERVFVLAYAKGERGQRELDERCSEGGRVDGHAGGVRPLGGVADARGGGSRDGDVGNAAGISDERRGSQRGDQKEADEGGERSGTPGERASSSGSPEGELADAVHQGPQGLGGGHGLGGTRQEGRAGWGGWWATEPNVGRVAHGVPFRVDRLRALGNSVVWQQAAYALTELMRRAGIAQ
ncbi:MAG: DNA cytosine methyltransferase [Planctomycetota bacterium]|nr:DNA cytosine methyltransferase [Planctomycetota bacterium]